MEGVKGSFVVCLSVCIWVLLRGLLLVLHAGIASGGAQRTLQCWESNPDLPHVEHGLQTFELSLSLNPRKDFNFLFIFWFLSYIWWYSGATPGSLLKVMGDHVVMRVEPGLQSAEHVLSPAELFVLRKELWSLQAYVMLIYAFRENPHWLLSQDLDHCSAIYQLGLCWANEPHWASVSSALKRGWWHGLRGTAVMFRSYNLWNMQHSAGHRVDSFPSKRKLRLHSKPTTKLLHMGFVFAFPLFKSQILF